MHENKIYKKKDPYQGTNTNELARSNFLISANFNKQFTLANNN